MRLHAPSPPQGKNNRSLLFSLLPPHLQYSPAQGISITPSGIAMAYEPVDWFDATFQQRIPLTINVNQVPSTQTNFPLLINDTFSELIGFSIDELRFASTDNIQLEYEIQKFNPVDGELIAWVLKPTVSDGDVINIYFDNPLAVDEQNAFAVWSDYSNVYHLNNIPAGVGSILDSTIAQEPGDPTDTTLVPGKIDSAQQFDDSIPSHIFFPLYAVDSSFSTSFWIRTFETNKGIILSVQENVGSRTAIFTEIQTNGTIDYLYISPPDFIGGVTINSSPVTVNDGNFHKVVFVYDDEGDSQKIYIDGVLAVSAADTQPPQANITPLQAFLGVLSPSTGVASFDGIMESFQTFVGVLSADRILAEFNNQNNQSTFYTKGSVEAVPVATIKMAYEPVNWADAAYLQRIPLTINGGQVPSTQNDFVLLINSIFPDLINQSEGSIRIGTNDFTVDYDIQEFNPVDGELIAWAKVPSISDGEVFNIYFDNPTAPDNQTPFEVWSEYEHVHYMNEVPAGVGSIKDSVVNASDGNPLNTTQVDGKIGKGQDFVPANDSNIIIPNYKVDFSFSISAWFKSTLNDQVSILAVVDEAQDTHGVYLAGILNNLRYLYRSPPGFVAGIDIFTNENPNDGVFHLAHIIFDDQNNLSKIYVDGVLKFNSGNTRPLLVDSFSAVIGKLNKLTSLREFEGIIQHIHSFRGVQTDDRISTEFNNQNAPDTFYSTGTVEAVPAATIAMGYEE